MTIDDILYNIYWTYAVGGARFGDIHYEENRRSLAKLVLEGRINQELVREAQAILAAPQDTI